MALSLLTTGSPARLPRGWRVVRREQPVWIAVSDGPAVGGISPRVAMSRAPETSDPRTLVRAHVSALFLADGTIRVIDEEEFETEGGQVAHRVLTSRIAGSVGLTTDHWVVSMPDGALVLAGAAPSVVWPHVCGQVRRALRAVVAAA